MENFRSIAIATATRHKELKERWTEKALQCHDALAAKEREIAALQTQMDVLRQERDALLDEKANCVAKIKQEDAYITAFDPELPFLSSDFRTWNGMTAENKWQKDIVLTILFGFYSDRNLELYDGWFHTFLQESAHDFEQSLQADAPQPIRDDRDIALARLIAFKSLLSGILRIDFPKHVWNNREIVITAVKYCPQVLGLEPKAVPDHFWNDREIVITAVKYCPQVLGLEPKAVPDHFLNDDAVFLAFTQVETDLMKSRHLTNAFSRRIRSNHALMLTLVKLCGRCVRYVAGSLDKNPEIIRAACGQDSCAWFDIDPSTAKDALLSDKTFMLSLFDRVAIRHSDFCQVYKSLPQILQEDPGVLRVVFKRRIVTIDDFPFNFPRGRDFWLGASCSQLMESSFWSQLPFEYKEDPEFLVTFRYGDDDEDLMPEHLIKKLPQLAGNRAFWTGVIQSDDICGNLLLAPLLSSHATADILRDHDLMLLACKGSSDVYEIIDATLKANREILAAAIDKEWFEKAFSFSWIPLNVQPMYPDLTCAALKQEEDRLVQLAQIAPELLSNLDVMKAFAEHNDKKNGNGPIPQGFPEAIKDNKDFGVFAAKFCHNYHEFVACTSVALRSSEEFMKKAVAVNPVCLAAGIGKLAKNFDVAVVAFGTTRDRQFLNNNFGSVLGDDYPDEDDHDYTAELTFLHSVAAKAREQIVAHEKFTKGFLYGTIENSGPECHLPMLFRDPETSAGLKDLISAFAGVPLARDIERLRVASLHLLFTSTPEQYAAEQQNPSAEE